MTLTVSYQHLLFSVCKVDIKIVTNMRYVQDTRNTSTEEFNASKVDKVREIILTLNNSAINEKTCFPKIMMIKLQSESVEVTI